MSARHQLHLKIAPWALLSVSAAWGLSFIIMKDSIERQNVNSFLFTRFGLAVVAMVLIRPHCLKFVNKDLLMKGTAAGLFLGGGYILQTLGLARTGAAITGFITGLYVVFTPLIAAVVLKARINVITWASVGVATVGLALLSLNGWSIGFGELLVLGSALGFGAHIIALGKWSNGRDAYAMTVVQLTVCTILSGLSSILEGGYQPPPDNGVWATVIFTAIVCTAVAFLIQTWSQAHMSTTKVAVILTMEVVFAAIFAIALGGETLTLQKAIGGVLVVIAMFVIVLKES